MGASVTIWHLAIGKWQSTDRKVASLSERPKKRKVLFRRLRGLLGGTVRKKKRNVPSVVCLLFGMCLFWNVSFFEYAIFGMYSFWNVLFLECYGIYAILIPYNICS